MKTKNFIYKAAAGLFSCSLLLASSLLTSCSADEFAGADPNGLPTVTGLEFVLTVDQETNQAHYSLPNIPAATYPIWIIDGASYSTLQSAGYTNTEPGTHTVELKLGNRNGFSQGSVTRTFTFEKELVNWTPQLNRIAGKEWRIDNKEVAHLACGEAGTDGTNWWSAQPDEKKAYGVYDDRITFTADNNKGGTYSYNPGEDGMTYVNTGCTKWEGNPGADWDVAIGPKTAGWHFEKADWADSNSETSSVVYLVLDANTPFPYISSDEQYENPRFRVESLTASKMVLVYEKSDRSIAWRFILTSKEGEKEFEGFDANSQYNMWKGITPSATFHLQPGWADVKTAAMEATYVGGDNDYTVTVPEACSDRWQAQFHLHTDLNITAASHYDFSCIFNADADIDGVTVKLTDETDADAIIDVDNVSLKKGEDFIFWRSDLEGKDLSKVKLVFDFGRAAGPTTINIRNVVLKDHANDDGTVLPNGDVVNPDAPTMDWNASAASNLWKAVEDGSAFKGTTTWFANDGWSALDQQPEVKHADGAYELTIPEGIGGSQWQGQLKIFTAIPASQAKKYNFYCTIDADQDISGVTIKLTQSDESESVKHDDNFFFDGRHDVKADAQLVYKAEGTVLPKGDAHELTLVLDFGGAPVGTNVKISNIYLEEVVAMDYKDEANLWRAVDEGSAFIGTTTWFANDGWSALDNQPEIKHDGNKWMLTVPEGIGASQWQGQVKIFTNLKAAQKDPYNFQCTILADQDIAGATIKLTQSDESESAKHDDNFYFDGRHDVKADEPYVYKATGVVLPKQDAHELTMVFDFGGAAAGTQIVISDIIFEKAQ